MSLAAAEPSNFALQFIFEYHSRPAGNPAKGFIQVRSVQVANYSLLWSQVAEVCDQTVEEEGGNVFLVESTVTRIEPGRDLNHTGRIYFEK